MSSGSVTWDTILKIQLQLYDLAAVMMYSSVASVGLLYAKIRIAAVISCKVDNQSLPDVSLVGWNSFHVA